MLQSLDIVTIQVNVRLGDDRVRRVKQIIEIVDIDPTTKEILTNEVFHWDPTTDGFNYSGKSYILERIRHQYDLTKEEIMNELRRRVEILKWMKTNNIRQFTDVANLISVYAENPEELLQKIQHNNHSTSENSTSYEKSIEHNSSQETDICRDFDLSELKKDSPNKVTSETKKKDIPTGGDGYSTE
jgi:hypothetical protein